MKTDNLCLDLLFGGLSGFAFTIAWSLAAGLCRWLRPAKKDDAVNLTVGGTHRRAVRSLTLTFHSPGGELADGDNG